MDFETFSAKTKSDAITEACTKLGVTSDRLEYEVVEEGSSGFLGFASKNAVIKARIKSEETSVEETVKAVAETSAVEEVSSINKEETKTEDASATAAAALESEEKAAESKEPKKEE